MPQLCSLASASGKQDTFTDIYHAGYTLGLDRAARLPVQLSASSESPIEVLPLEYAQFKGRPFGLAHGSCGSMVQTAVKLYLAQSCYELNPGLMSVFRRVSIEVIYA